eukprot:CAMPEP_0170634690 /NCGR_PEP_ID=MMETSP0224-20130122/36757_1 /TAXON_ID=285029 /ORGANISM="Togula jolla, Strain CCCM 725" /LENGTH=83 /DNA_ID=CAMNT_0010964009 /DNA_START=232 /DNA_END=479 /DNA_ORIENTATION=+
MAVIKGEEKSQEELRGGDSLPSEVCRLDIHEAGRQEGDEHDVECEEDPILSPLRDQTEDGNSPAPCKQGEVHGLRMQVVEHHG